MNIRIIEEERETQLHVFYFPSSGNTSWIEITEFEIGSYISFDTKWDGQFIIAKEPPSSSRKIDISIFFINYIILL